MREFSGAAGFLWLFLAEKSDTPPRASAYDLSGILRLRIAAWSPLEQGKVKVAVGPCLCVGISTDTSEHDDGRVESLAVWKAARKLAIQAGNVRSFTERDANNACRARGSSASERMISGLRGTAPGSCA